MNRRHFLFLSALFHMASCTPKNPWPEGMVEIKWDRDSCARCQMIISDRRFAAEIKGARDNQLFKFDDPGCLILWKKEKQREYPWLLDADIRLWVADANARLDTFETERFINPLTAHYIRRTSPMGYNFAAVRDAVVGSRDFAAVEARLLPTKNQNEKS